MPVRVDYAVRALIDLSQVEQGIPLRSSDIASRQRIPEPYLDQLLTALNKSGLVSSRRGPGGGHTLAKRPAEIRLSDLFTALRVSMAPPACADSSYICGCDDIPESDQSCVRRSIWGKVDDIINSTLGSLTIYDLANVDDSGPVI